MFRQPSAALAAASTVQRWRAAFACLVAGVAAFRLWFATALPLSGDEAYFWEWSRHLALGYYDHPPLVAWVLALATRLLPASSELAVRLPAIVAMLACAVVCRRFALRLAAPLGLDGAARERAACVSGLLVLAVPVLAFFGVYASGDPLLYLCWALAMDLGWRAASDGNRGAWLGLGLAVGAGLQAKFLFALFLPAYALFLLSATERRRWFARRELWLAAGVAALVNLPFLLWNARHGWVTFRFNLSARHDFVDGWVALIELAASQALVLTPVVFLWAVLASARILRRWRASSSAELYLALLFAVPLAAHASASLGGVQVGAHWPAAAALGMLVLLAARIERLASAASVRRARLAPLGCAAALSALGPAAVLLPPEALAGLALSHPTREEQFHTGRVSELHGWRELGRRVAEVRAELLAAQVSPRGAFVLAAQYGVAAQVAFYTPGQPAVLLWEPPRRHGQACRAWDRFEPLRGQDAVFVTKHERLLARSTAELREHCARVSAPERLAIVRTGRELRAFFLVRCEDFDGVAPSFP